MATSPHAFSTFSEGDHMDYTVRLQRSVEDTPKASGMPQVSVS
ncbi:MAG: hypothetical protein QOK33_5414 [Mycobacterium sp.]|nr:hypothetical protein [Mycobacterium sp.]